MLHPLCCSKSYRIFKGFFFKKSQLKRQILAVVHIFKDYVTTFPHNVLQFPRYNTLCPNLKTTYPFFFFLFYNLAYSVLITWNALYTSSVMNFCFCFFSQNFTSNKPLPSTCPQFLSTMIKSFFTVCIDFSVLNYVFSTFIVYTFQMLVIIILLKIFVAWWVIHRTCSVNMCWMELNVRGLCKNNSKSVEWISIDIQDQKSDQTMWSTLVKEHSCGIVIELDLV